MTTVTAVVQPTEPPRVRITIEDVVSPEISLLENGSFETPDMGDGVGVDYFPVPWYEYLTVESPNAARAPFVQRQGPNNLTGMAPDTGSHYFIAAYTPDTVNPRSVWMAQRVSVAEGLRVKADAKMQASNASDAGSALVLQVVPMIGDQAAEQGGVATIAGPTFGAWQSLHAEVTIPAGYNEALIMACFQGTPTSLSSVSLIDSVTANASEPDIASISLWREVDGVRSPVRGAQDLPPTTDALVINDNEAPFGEPVTYILVKAYTDGTSAETSAEPVELTTELPWISHPITGVGVTATITDWPDLVYAARQTLVSVAGRARPISISDRRLAASSELVMLTKTRETLLYLRALLAMGDTLLVRPACDAVEGDYLAIGDVTETRVKPNGEGAGSDWRRLVTMAAQVVDAPDTAIPAIGDTLADLNAYVPTTLADLAEAFGTGATLLTIAETNLTVV